MINDKHLEDLVKKAELNPRIPCLEPLKKPSNRNCACGKYYSRRQLKKCGLLEYGMYWAHCPNCKTTMGMSYKKTVIERVKGFFYDHYQKYFGKQETVASVQNEMQKERIENVKGY